jgi:hypothetical protein
LTGHRVAVWEVLSVYEETKSRDKTAEHFRCRLRRTVRSTDYGYQARLLTGFWRDEGHGSWDWINRILDLHKSP